LFALRNRNFVIARFQTFADAPGNRRVRALRVGDRASAFAALRRRNKTKGRAFDRLAVDGNDARRFTVARVRAATGN